VAERLVGDHRVIVPDRPGYGATHGPAAGLDGNAEVLAELLDGLGVDRAVAVGHSYGAAVALRLAERFPERVGALVLVCPAGSPGALGPADRLLAVPWAGEAVAFAAMRGSATVGLWLSRRLPPDRLGLPPERLEALVRAWGRTNIWRSFAAEQRALVGEMPALAAGLAYLEAPVTILAGRRDRVVRPSAVLDLARRLPAAELVWSQEGGHLLPWRHPELVADVVRGAAGRL
jgi:pimeloyl-ACP methyl ester carboxylesterase